MTYSKEKKRTIPNQMENIPYMKYIKLMFILKASPIARNEQNT